MRRILRKWIVIPLGFLGVLLYSFTAAAVVCYPYKEVEKRLAAQYKEFVSASGIVKDKIMVVVFSSLKQRTFSIVLVTLEPNGDKKGCFVSSGNGWTQYSNPPTKKEMGL